MNSSVEEVSASPKRYINSGMHYLNFIEAFAKLLDAQSYFEIGVNKGKSLRRVNVASVGVDPEFIIEANVTGGKPSLHLYQMTSDDFFDQVGLSKDFPNGVDLAFLDGMHLFEFLLRDFMNVERSMTAGGVVLLHDCLPINSEMAERERRTGLRKDLEYRSHWTGDVWKVVDILKSYRPDLTVDILDCVPTGLTIISQLNPNSRVLHESYDEIVEKFMGLETNDDDLESFRSRHQVKSADEYLETIRLG